MKNEMIQFVSERQTEKVRERIIEPKLPLSRRSDKFDIQEQSPSRILQRFRNIFVGTPKFPLQKGCLIFSERIRIIMEEPNGSISPLIAENDGFYTFGLWWRRIVKRKWILKVCVEARMNFGKRFIRGMRDGWNEEYPAFLRNLILGNDPFHPVGNGIGWSILRGGTMGIDLRNINWSI